MTFINALPGAFAQGLCWGIMALGVFLSYKILDFADLTVDGSLCTGAAVFAVLLNAGAGLAVANVGAAALGLVGEKPEMLGTTLIYLGLAEGIAIYGVIISLLIIQRL